MMVRRWLDSTSSPEQDPVSARTWSPIAVDTMNGEKDWLTSNKETSLLCLNSMLAEILGEWRARNPVLQTP
jgi:hypothetical protein